MFSLLICFIFLRINNNNQPVSFKKRNKYKILIPKLIFGDCGLFFLKNYNLEIIYFFQLKKKIKIFLKKNKFWVFLNKNYPISRKSKNARMGKGKGNYSRIVYKVFANKMFMEFKKKNIYTLLKIKKFLKKKNNLKTHYWVQ